MQAATLVIYDLRDAEAWKQADQDRRAWGREMTEVHDLDKNHVVIAFRTDEAFEASA